MWNLWPKKKQASVVIDSVGVRREIRGGHESIAWDRLVEVAIATTSDGPLGDDLFWLLIADDKTGCAVPGTEAADLLKRLQRLPGFDNLAVVQASGSTDEALFPAWKGALGDARVCAADVDSPPPHA